jgi:YD repeat-containing protein
MLRHTLGEGVRDAALWVEYGSPDRLVWPIPLAVTRLPFQWGDMNMAIARLAAFLLSIAMAVVTNPATAAGTAPHRWSISGNIGSCGSFSLPDAGIVNDFGSFGEATEKMLAALNDWGCTSYSSPTIIGTFPQISVCADPNSIPNCATTFTVGAFCRAHVNYAVLPTGGCNATNVADPSKGAGCDGCKRANPVSVGNLNKYLEQVDYQGTGTRALRFVRYYNSLAPRGEEIGAHWTHTYQRRVVFETIAPGVATAYRQDGQAVAFRSPDGQTFTLDPDVRHTLEQLRDAGGQITGWRFYDAGTEAVDLFDAEGWFLSTTSREGLTTSLTYSDGTSDPATGGTHEGTTIPLPQGLPIRVTGPFGRSLTFGYDTANHIVRMTDPDGKNTTYVYDALSRLVSVTDPGNKTLTYHYGESDLVSRPDDPQYKLLLTGITDQNGNRHSKYAYMGGDRRVSMSTRLAGGVEVYRHDYTYGHGFEQITETDPLGVVRTFSNIQPNGVGITQTISGSVCPSCGPQSRSYDSNANVASRTDWNGHRTNYTYDLARNLEISRTDGLTSGGGATPATRTITTEWHPTLRLVARVAEPLRITTYVYNGDGSAQCASRPDGSPVPGVLCSKTVQATTDPDGGQGLSASPVGAPRAWSYSYNVNGRVLSVDGPRTDLSDVTTYSYYADDDPDLGKRGNVATVTNAAGHVTQITAYNAHGQPTTIVDPNGLTTTLAYDPRQRLTSRTIGDETTRYAYDGVGQLTRVTLPDGSFLGYSYDSAHRLTAMQDNLGNRIAYALDVMGNRSQEQVLDPANNLAQTRRRVYSNLNRLLQEVGALGQTTEYTYDNQGNVIAVKDPLNRTTTNAYDALNRLAQVTDPNSGVTAYGYNGLDALVSVTDPRSLATGYTVDGLGNLVQQTSPDTGTTVNSYDAAGNLLTQTDAKGQVTTYVYDSLNRVSSITFNDGSKQTYVYDQGANGLGRLSAIAETNPAQQLTNQIAYAYDAHGRVSSETRTVAGQSYVTAYRYDSAGRLSGMTYPSGRSVAYALDALGRIEGITTTSGSQNAAVVQGVYYHPFGGVKAFTFGNGQVYSRSIDQDGRIASYTLGAARYDIAFDAASRIAGIAEMGNPSNANAYGYDNLDRLTSAVLPSSGFGYSYDAVGNRLTKLVGGTVHSYSYSPTSNRIASIQPTSGPVRNFVFDANGSTTSDGVNTYAYDARGRMVQATSALGATNYQVNALGQRVRKTNALGDTVFHYDTRGHLIAETDSGGATKREYIYLGDIPVGVVQ